jgi:membrane-associated phospholipid phosphatase
VTRARAGGLARPHRLPAILALAGLALSTPARAGDDPPAPVRLDPTFSLSLTGGALAGALATELLKDRLAPTHCRVCTPGRLDAWLQDQLAWSHPGGASTASDVLGVGVPAAAAGALALAGWQAGGARTAAEDLLVTAEATSVAILATQVVKLSVGRLRPNAYHAPAAPRGPDAFFSFWSGHTAAAFAAAAAAGQVARLRGYRRWPWILGLGLAGAAACGYLRVAADRHWTTDVLAGAAVGTSSGLGLPVLLHRPREDRTGGLELTVLPSGIAGRF